MVEVMAFSWARQRSIEKCKHGWSRFGIRLNCNQMHLSFHHEVEMQSNASSVDTNLRFLFWDSFYGWLYNIDVSMFWCTSSLLLPLWQRLSYQTLKSTHESKSHSYIILGKTQYFSALLWVDVCYSQVIVLSLHETSPFFTHHAVPQRDFYTPRDRAHKAHSDPLTLGASLGPPPYWVLESLYSAPAWAVRTAALGVSS